MLVALNIKKTIFARYKQLRKSIWLFPILLLIPLVLLTIFKISGSSHGFYYNYFYGDTSADPNLIAGKPRPIRSDEWLVNTQVTIAQASNNFERINDNVGNGQDMSLIIDAPYKDWSVIFKPHHWPFFVLPLDHAFAMRWWLMGYFLTISSYLLMLKLLPDKRLIASLLAVAFFFSPFVQWWYLIGTLGSLYWGLFAAVIITNILKQQSRRKSILLGVGLSYTAVGFALVLYPPFQIPVALALIAFLIGFAIEKLRNSSKQFILEKLIVITSATVVAGVITLLFFLARQNVIDIVRNTAYPGQRIAVGGGFDIAHLLSSHLAPVFQWTSRAAQYTGGPSVINQSETSNFILLVPYLFIPSILLLWYNWRKNKQVDWPLLTVNIMFVLFLVRLYGPSSFDPFFKLLLLEVVPLKRMLIGIGLLNLLHIGLFMRSFMKIKRRLPIHQAWIYTYATLIFALQLWLGMFARERSPGFIDYWMIFVLAIPIAVTMVLFLKRYFTLAALSLLGISLMSTIIVNPLYRGLGTLTETPLAQEIQTIANNNDGLWATESIFLENFATMNGANSLSSVYIYPQLDLWRPLDDGSEEYKYNRYAHVSFGFDRIATRTIDTDIKLLGGDHFRVLSEPCSDYLRDQNVRYLLAVSAPLQPADSCITLIKTILYPANSFYIYELNF